MVIDNTKKPKILIKTCTISFNLMFMPWFFSLILLWEGRGGMATLSHPYNFNSKSQYVCFIIYLFIIYVILNLVYFSNQ